MRTGGGPAEVELATAAGWTPAERAERLDLAAELLDRLAAIGDPSAHPWRGVRCRPLDPPEQRALETQVATLATHLRGAVDAASDSQQLGVPAAVTIADLDPSALGLATAAALPEADRAALAAPGARRPTRYCRCRMPGVGMWPPPRWRMRPSFPRLGKRICRGIRIAIATKGRKLFRFLDGGYRAQIALLRSYLKDKPPSDPMGGLRSSM